MFTSVPAGGLFPTTVDELGGTTNVQDKILRAAGHDGFVHLELSRPLRRRLRDDGSALLLERCLP